MTHSRLLRVHMSERRRVLSSTQCNTSIVQITCAVAYQWHCTCSTYDGRDVVAAPVTPPD